MQRYEVISKLTSRGTTGRWKIRKLGNERIRKLGNEVRAAQAVKLANGKGLRDSEGNGRFQKRVVRNFDEKRV